MDNIKARVLIDLPKKGWSHMVSDNIPFLHKFAEEIGIKKCWYENKRGKKRPHYDVREGKVADAIENGALLVDSRYIIEFLKEHYD